MTWPDGGTFLITPAADLPDELRQGLDEQKGQITAYAASVVAMRNTIRFITVLTARRYS